MSDVNLVPGRPIRRDRFCLAIHVLGLDPAHVTAFEANTKAVEVSHGNMTYSRHEIVDVDPWASDDPDVLVVDLAGLPDETKDLARSFASWLRSRRPV